MPRPQINADLDIIPAYAKAYHWKGRYMLLYGGSDSGKSWFVAQKKIIRAMGAVERFLLVRKVYATCRWSVYQQIKDVMKYTGIEEAAHFRDSTADIFFPNGSAMITCGMDNLDKIKSFAGFTSAWVEEGSELNEADINEIDRRMRGEAPSYHQIVISANPLPTARYLKDVFIDGKKPDTYYQHTTVYDNPYATTAAVLEGIRDKTERAIYLEGKWAAHLEGLIYPKWETAPFPESDDVFWGVDFGFINPAVAVKCCVRDVEDGPYLHVHEGVYEAGLTNALFAERMFEAGYERGQPCYCDNAEPKSIRDLTDAGIRALPADKSVAEGLKRVREHKIRFTPMSVNLHREASLYRRKPDTSRYAETGEFVEDPIKKDDHGMDAMRYAVFTHQGKHWFVYD